MGSLFPSLRITFKYVGGVFPNMGVLKQSLGLEAALQVRQVPRDSGLLLGIGRLPSLPEFLDF